MFYRMELIFLQFFLGPALVTTKDAGDAITLLQSLTGSTFDSSQLVLTACMGYQNVHEKRLHELRNKHRPAVRAALEERSKGMRVWRDSQGLASKLYGFKQDSNSESMDTEMNGNVSVLDASPANVDELFMGLNGDRDVDPAKDLQEQVTIICFPQQVILKKLYANCYPLQNMIFQ